MGTFACPTDYNPYFNQQFLPQFGVMVTEKSFWDKKLPLFVESPI
jgi:hypothetical protein